MEVGAVKHAFNNEVILLKKKLNQAKIQIIHKLTRKAKTLTEKKAPEKLKGKFTKKAESAVKEVLIIKKINAKDLAKFIVTHKGNLNDYLNRPQVDEAKACARLLLHKALQDKYKSIRERFSNVSIEDLFMSRVERKKMKKEARDKQKEKKKRKEGKEPIQAEGNWNVEDIEMDDSKTKLNSLSEDNDDGKETDEQSDDENQSDDDIQTVDDKQLDIDKQSDDDTQSDSDNESDKNGDLNENVCSKSKKTKIEEPQDNSSNDDETESKDVGTFVKLMPNKTNVMENNAVSHQTGKVSDNKKKRNDKKPKDSNKNKNLKDKILKKKFHKTTEDMPVKENKVVDPFFITSTGENYMSVAEPRPPDEFKEVHRQGNRQYRRAVMFGHVPKNKPRRENFRPDNQGFRNNGSEPKGKQKRFNKEDNYKAKFNDRSNNKKDVEVETKPEKLHPSWEAKKRQSGILPFKGKKIVFDET